jgi:hypothetical protein
VATWAIDSHTLGISIRVADSDRLLLLEEHTSKVRNDVCDPALLGDLTEVWISHLPRSVDLLMVIRRDKPKKSILSHDGSDDPRATWILVQRVRVAVRPAEHGWMLRAGDGGQRRTPLL